MTSLPHPDPTHIVSLCVLSQALLMAEIVASLCSCIRACLCISFNLSSSSRAAANASHRSSSCGGRGEKRERRGEREGRGWGGERRLIDLMENSTNDLDIIQGPECYFRLLDPGPWTRERKIEDGHTSPFPLYPLQGCLPIKVIPL